MIRVKIIILQISILTGALLFLNCSLIANDLLSDIDFKKTDSIPGIDTQQTAKKPLIEDKIKKIDAPDSEKETADTVNRKKERIPQKATIYSAVLPGLGQAYNHKYWKIPVIYVAGGVIYYFYNDNNKKYKDFKKEYEEEVHKGIYADQDSLNYFKDGKDYFRKWRDYNIIFMSALYLINIIDAMADAYFTQFDINDKLSMKVLPSVVPLPTAYQSNISVGLKLSFRF